MPAPEFVLASASPARLSTLRAAGIDPHVAVSGVDEDAVIREVEEATGSLDPVEVALVLARAKATDVAGRLRRDGRRALVLGCDSVLELDGRVHGKPADRDEAITRWHLMRGRSGVLHTGHWLVDDRARADGGTRGTIGAAASTTVHFADLSDEEITSYVDSGEPLRVAGAFTIDGLGGAFVRGIEGDHHTVVGLSLPLLRELLLDVGVGWFDLAGARTTQG